MNGTDTGAELVALTRWLQKQAGDKHSRVVLRQRVQGGENQLVREWRLADIVPSELAAAIYERAIEDAAQQKGAVQYGLFAYAEGQKSYVDRTFLNVDGGSKSTAIATLDATLEDHRGHVDELAVVVRNLGGEPASPSDLRPLGPPRRLPGPLNDEHALLEALGRNEEGARAAYEDAASLPGVPLDVLAALERNLADQRKHLAWLAGRLETILASAEAPRSEPCSTTLK